MTNRCETSWDDRDRSPFKIVPVLHASYAASGTFEPTGKSVGVGQSFAFV